MHSIVINVVLVVLAYLLGSINSAILLSKAMNLPDPRSLGSGNPGATNVLRTGNKLAAAITLLGDLLKGLIPVLIAKYFHADVFIIAIVCLAALLGHIYPIYYRFQGGKGVATTLGVLFAVEWLLALLWIAVWLAVAALFRYSSLAALTATFSMACITWIWFEQAWIPCAFVLIVALVFWRHRSNIENLLAGNETKIGKKDSAGK